MNINDIIGRNIRLQRSRCGLTLSDVADRICDEGYKALSAMTIGRWERGDIQIPADVLLPLSKVLHCSPCAFYDMPKKEENLLEKRLLEEIEALPDHEKEILLKIATSWVGDNHGLIEVCGLYACLPVASREYIARICIEEYVYCENMGELISDIDINLEKIQEAWKRLERERGET